MADLEQPYHAHVFADLGVTLKRFYLNTPDELGTVKYWETYIRQLYSQMPFPDLWRGWVLEIWHKDCKTGPFVQWPGALGLTWPNVERSALKCDPANIKIAQSALSHEVGHWYANESEVYGVLPIQKKLSALFSIYHDGPGSNEAEKWAEAYRYYLGDDVVRGTFGGYDGYFRPSEMIRTLLTCAYWLNGNLKNKTISGFTLHETWCEWVEESRRYWWQWFPDRTSYALTRGWDLFMWTGEKWSKV